MTNNKTPARIELIDEIAHFLAMPATTDADTLDDARAYIVEMIFDQPLDVLIGLDATDRELLTTACLALSICPVHLVDYAICFDDDDDACRAVRMIHPIHDT